MGQPFSILWSSEMSSPTRTWIFLPVKKFWIHRRILPYSLSLRIVLIGHIRSKAFSKSRVAATTTLRSMNAKLISVSSLGH